MSPLEKVNLKWPHMTLAVMLQTHFCAYLHCREPERSQEIKSLLRLQKTWNSSLDLRTCFTDFQSWDDVIAFFLVN